MTPRVTILMPVFNGERYLRESIGSILAQTFKDFELLIIDDGSTDGTRTILEAYNDPRISVVHQKNMGLTKSLNKGIAMSKGEYIARMDSDDISLAARIAKQVAFMDANQAVGICGTWVKIIGSETGDIWRYPIDSDIIRCKMLFQSSIVHPSAMIRKSFLVKHGLTYDEKFERAQDYDFWVRCAKVFPLANIGEVLVLYRLHPYQTGREHSESQRSFANMVRRAQLSEMGLAVNEDEFILHVRLSEYDIERTMEFVRRAEAWLLKLDNTNKMADYYPRHAFEKVLGECWYSVCSRASSLGLKVWKFYWQSSLSSKICIKTRQKMRFIIKCGLKLNVIF